MLGADGVGGAVLAGGAEVAVRYGGMGSRQGVLPSGVALSVPGFRASPRALFRAGRVGGELRD
ncbi:hypothetical protein GCM10010329_25890 [Streptomyces spiroverticillatus]|uniref:Uncharacterized protein n=1 Tax=Streptomyces finlayi TaxID=67296 RepID=A0A918WVC6_9ACTN|nr:hypothetical protein GCM10010329_25890 [Streptomyces spiroverticillatus]GHC86899.1 hypothetical protein GCM10010334_18300 [Streptomyces finlayi]